MKGEKTGGREKGTPNKGTIVIRQKIRDFLELEIDTIFEDIKQLEPKDRLNFYFKMMNYIVPTIKPLERGATEKPMFDLGLNKGELID